ncbi:MAG: helix-turn-helix domain-containing protein [Cystobacter sp.]
MSARMTPEQEAARRTSILKAARWCFLHFGYGKTSLEDIAKRANISRTLLYRMFKDKEDLFSGVFEDLIETRHPVAEQVVAGPGSRAERLLKLCEVMLLEPWAEMVGAPMAREFYDVCARIEPEVEARHEKFMLKSVQALLEHKELSEVFLLALEGLQLDIPETAVLRRRVKVLIERFAPAA